MGLSSKAPVRSTSGPGFALSRRLLAVLALAGMCLASQLAVADAQGVAPSPRADPRGTIYEVQAGDTLTSIAAQFGVDVETIVQANRLANADHIVPGQQLTILPVPGLVYVVRRGDTLHGIAARYGIDLEAILSWNEIEDPDLIVVGAELFLPGARAPRPSSVGAPVRAAPPAAPGDEEGRDGTPSEEEGGRVLYVKVTAYAPGAGARNPTTRSGTPIRWGVVAVDPQVIPLGSRIRIEGFDEVFYAEDTGPAVRGAHVEIFYPDPASAVRFGVQTRRITILE